MPFVSLSGNLSPYHTQFIAAIKDDKAKYKQVRFFRPGSHSPVRNGRP